MGSNWNRILGHPAVLSEDLSEKNLHTEVLPKLYVP